MLFQFRDVSWAKLEELEACLAGLIQESNRRERCPATLHCIRRSVPALCDPALMAAVESAAERNAPGAWQTLPSGAGHDAQVLAEIMPSAMLFCPSIGGISHHWAEDTAEPDLALCCQILGDAAATLLTA